MHLPVFCALAFFALVSVVKPAAALDKIKFPYSPISYHSLPFLVAYEAKLFEKRGLALGNLGLVSIAGLQYVACGIVGGNFIMRAVAPSRIR